MEWMHKHRDTFNIFNLRHIAIVTLQLTFEAIGIPNYGSERRETMEEKAAE